MVTPPRVRRILAANLRSAAKRQGKSVVVLADFADVSVAHLYDVIAARKAASVDFVARVAEALRMEPWQLLVPNDSERSPQRRRATTKRRQPSRSS